jgi:hypothetical protein
MRGFHDVIFADIREYLLQCCVKTMRRDAPRPARCSEQHAGLQAVVVSARPFALTTVVGSPMRYHKAIRISRSEACFIIGATTWSRNDLVVMSHRDEWYDVRPLTKKELDEFLDDLLRADIADLQAGCITPH